MPDGQHIVSGSYEQTIRVWNAMTGETAAGPFTRYRFSQSHSRMVELIVRVSNVTIGKIEIDVEVDFTDH
jgi:WD40 repeat protein